MSIKRKICTTIQMTWHNYYFRNHAAISSSMTARRDIRFDATANVLDLGIAPLRTSKRLHPIIKNRLWTF